MRLITIEYHRLPDRVSYLPSMLLYEDERRMVVLNMLNRANPLIVNGHCLIEKGCTGVWLVDTREWYDLGAVYDCNHLLRGYYCDITTPAERTETGYRTTDLMLDLCVLPDKSAFCLDVDEFEEGIRKGVIDGVSVEQARHALANLQQKAMQGNLPTREVKRLLALPPNVEEIREQIIESRSGKVTP